MESIEHLAAAVPDLIVEVPNRRNWFSLRLSDLPPSLADDINSWQMHELGKTRRNAQSASNGGRPSGEKHVAGTRRRRRPIRATSAQSYLRLLLSFITMEVGSGIPLDSLRTLVDVVDLDNVDQGLTAYQKHFGGIKRRHLGQVMRVLCIIAGHWVRVGDEHLEELRAWTYEVSSDERYAMSAATREAVRSLRDLRTLARLLTAAETVITQLLSRPRLLSRMRCLRRPHSPHSSFSTLRSASITLAASTSI